MLISPTLHRVVPFEVWYLTLHLYAIKQRKGQVGQCWVEQEGNYVQGLNRVPLKIEGLLSLMSSAIIDQLPDSWGYQAKKYRRDTIGNHLVIISRCIRFIVEAAFNQHTFNRDKGLEWACDEREYVKDVLNLLRPVQIEVLDNHQHLEIVSKYSDEHSLRLASFRMTTNQWAMIVIWQQCLTQADKPCKDTAQ